ncbi:hypothetical protein H4F99_00490 [Lysobacter sp. SG-8]|uniref:Transmembrane protein n=1 Tax=Marilutibacter penaei TaxID=2759900 RepID=A0A7W3U147_9GAMM|nr:hypothetical protein [Lysobacter penaei]MBB1086959.1 hypothetical protein [Lysobacter penaei]
MSVTLIATVVALVLGHLAPSLANAVRSHGWFTDWLRWLDGRFDEGSFWRGPWGVLVALAPPLLLVAIFQAAVDGAMFGLAGLLFGIAVLFYAWGPRDLDVDVDAVVQAPDPASRRAAAERLWPDDSPPSLASGPLVDAVFQSSVRRWFGVLFWFLLLGPFGALLYRLTALAAHGDAARQLPAGTVQGARTLLTALEWPVAQLVSLALAIVGNFDTVLAAWKENGGASLAFDTRFLGAVGRASVRSELAEEAGDYAVAGEPDETEAGGNRSVAAIPALTGDFPELRDAMSLVWRVLLAWLAVIALFVIAGYVN